MARERKVFSSPSGSSGGEESDDPLDLIERPSPAVSRTRIKSASAPSVTPSSARSYVGAKRRKLSDGSSVPSDTASARSASRSPTPPLPLSKTAATSSDAEMDGARPIVSPLKGRGGRKIVSDGSEDEEDDSVPKLDLGTGLSRGMATSPAEEARAAQLSPEPEAKETAVSADGNGDLEMDDARVSTIEAAGARSPPPGESAQPDPLGTSAQPIVTDGGEGYGEDGAESIDDHAKAAGSERVPEPPTEAGVQNLPKSSIVSETTDTSLEAAGSHLPQLDAPAADSRNQNVQATHEADVDIGNDIDVDDRSLAEASPAAARPEELPVDQQATTDSIVELQTGERPDEPGPGHTDALSQADILARVLGLTGQSESLGADKPDEGLGQTDKGEVIAVDVDGRNGQGVRAAADDGLVKAERPSAVNVLEAGGSSTDLASAQMVGVRAVDDAGLDSHKQSADSETGVATGAPGVPNPSESIVSPFKPEPAAEDDSISAAFNLPSNPAAPGSHAPLETSIAAHVLEPATASSSAAPSPVPSTTSAPSAPAPAPAEEIYGYLSGRPILGYTATGRPILGKATDTRALTYSVASGSSSADQASVSAKEREKQRKAKVAAQAKEKEAAKNAKAKALIEREKEDAEATRRREKELREQTERDRKEEARVKDVERKAKEREEKEREKKEVKETKGKGGKKGKVEDLKGKARSTSASSPSAKASSPDIASSAATTPEPVKPSPVSKGKATGNSHRGSSVVQPLPDEAEEEEDDDEVYCPCGRLGREDGQDDLVGCDACDHWYHAGCVGLKSDDLERIDSFICQSCEKLTSQRTTFQKVCARPACGIMFAGRQSKFCSSSCGIKHARSLLASLPPRNLPELSAALADFPSPPPEIRIIDHADYPDPTPASTAAATTIDASASTAIVPLIGSRGPEIVMRELQQQLQAVRAQLALTTKRQRLAEGLMDRCDSLPSINSSAGVAAEDGSRKKDKTKSKSKSKPAGASSDDRPCGWSEVIIWDEQEVGDWDGDVPILPEELQQPANAEGDAAEIAERINGARQGMGEWNWCDRPRKRCERHAGWQKTVLLSLEREAEELNARLVSLESQLSESKESQEATTRGRTARAALHEQLALHVARKVV